RNIRKSRSPGHPLMIGAGRSDTFGVAPLPKTAVHRCVRQFSQTSSLHGVTIELVNEDAEVTAIENVISSASLIACLSFGAYGQVTPKSPAFDVTSVRPNRTRDRGSVEFPKGGERFTATNMPLAAIIVIAYNITVRQFSGADPLLSERYDIAAK